MATTNVSVGTYASNVLAASGDIVELQFAAGASDIALVLAGTFSGTVQFEAGLANLTTGVTWTALLCNPIPSGSAASSATAVGTWQASIVGFTHFRFRCSAYASGRVYATVNAALAADGGGVITGNPTALQLAGFSSATQVSGIPNSSFDEVTGKITLSAPFEVGTTGDIELEASGGDGLVLVSRGAGPAVLDATQGTGYVAIQGSNGTYVLSNSTTDDLEIDAVGSDIGGGGTKAISLVTAGGLKMNGTPGVSGTGTTMTNITVVNGIITAATFT